MSGSLIEDQMVEDSHQCDYVVFYLSTGIERSVMEKFISVSPEYKELSRNYIDRIETVLFSRADSASGYTLATSLQYNGQCTVEQTAVELSEGTEAYGPVLNLRQGRYFVLLHGNDFDDVECEATYKESNILNLKETARDDLQIGYTFDLDEPGQVKLRIQNNSQNPAKLYGIELITNA